MSVEVVRRSVPPLHICKPVAAKFLLLCEFLATH